MKKKNSFLLLVVLFLQAQCLIGQDFKVSVGVGSSYQVSTPVLGVGAGVEIAYKLKPNFYIGYEYLYAVVDKKTASYGNQLADGLGYKNQIFGNIIGAKYFLNPKICIGFLSAQVLYMLKKNSTIKRLRLSALSMKVLVIGVHLVEYLVRVLSITSLRTIPLRVL